jgi:HK97 family phage major capsid protein
MDMDTKKIESALAQISDQTKEIGEKAMSEAKKAGDMSTETKGRVDELLLKQGELQAALREVQQKQEAGGGFAEESMTAGQTVVNSAEFAMAKEQIMTGRKANVSIKVKAITTAVGSVGQAIAPDRREGVMMLPNRRMTVRDLLMPGRTSSGVVVYSRESGFTNNAAVVAEGARKPESNITMVSVTETVKKIATYVKASTEVMSDLPQLRSIIDIRLRYMLALREEAQLLMGSGVGNNLNGIFTQASAFVVPTGSTAPTTPIDKLRLALLQSELAEYPADGIVLNPIDWTNIEILKDTQGRYLIGNPQGTLAPTLWNRPVVSTQSMTQNQFLVGAFGMGAQIFDREDANVVIATENEQDFVENLVTILIEERLALAVYRTEAFCKGTLVVTP